LDFRGARGTYVVLDATEINRDWFLRGPDFEFLRFLISEAGLRAAIPESVVAETVANQKRELHRARKQLEKAKLSLRRVAGRDVDLGPDFVTTGDYAELLTARLEILDIETLGLPDTSHAEVVRRATERVPPFDQSGSGYRDTLVWLSCLELAAAGETVFLVSQDKDFAGGDHGLATPLAEELAELPGSVTLVRHLGPWLLHLAPWDDVTSLKEALVVARDEVVATWFAPWDMFEDPRFTAHELGLPPSTQIHDVEYAGSGDMIIKRLGSTRLDDGSHRVTYEFPIEFSVEMSLPTEDARSEGLLTQDGDPSGVESISTVIPLVGQMTVIHDHTQEWPYEYESFDFRPVRSATASAADTEQLSLPIDSDESGDDSVREDGL
jgi:hypothetical protein